MTLPTMPHPAPLWTSALLRQATHGHLMAELAVYGVSIDTRQIKKGDLFIALLGHHSDGHAYIAQAFAQGAACVLAHNAESVAASGFSDDPRILMVKDSFQALEALGRFARARFRGEVIAITGSVGKTTTKDMLSLALSAYGRVHASVASYNNHWGVPLTLARLPEDADFCISEAGMNHPGEIAPLAAQIRPSRAVITTIGSAHLGHMGSISAIAAEKAALLSVLPAHGIGLVPDDVPSSADDAFIKALPDQARLWYCGTSDRAIIRITNLHCTDTTSQFDLHIPAPSASETYDAPETYKVTLNASGAHLARNAALVLGVIASLDLNLPPAIEKLALFQSGAGRGQKRYLGNGSCLLDESYNASGLSMLAALENLALSPAARHLAALGDILELGDFAETEHRALAAPIIAHHIICFCCGPHMKSLYDALPDRLRGGYAADARALALMVKPYLEKGDVLLVKGSFGSQMRLLVAALDEAFPASAPPSSSLPDSSSVVSV